MIYLCRSSWYSMIETLFGFYIRQLQQQTNTSPPSLNPCLSTTSTLSTLPVNPSASCPSAAFVLVFFFFYNRRFYCCPKKRFTTTVIDSSTKMVEAAPSPTYSLSFRSANRSAT